MTIFKGQNLLEFSDRFKTGEDCKEYLAASRTVILRLLPSFSLTRCISPVAPARFLQVKVLAGLFKDKSRGVDTFGSFFIFSNIVIHRFSEEFRILIKLKSQFS